MNEKHLEHQLRQFYPKGISRDDLRYRASKEFKSFENLVVNTVHKPSSLYKEWQEFLRYLSDKIGQPVSDYTDGQVPSFFAHLPKSPSMKELILPGLKEDILIYKSFLSDAFCVFGTRNIHWTNSMGFTSITSLEALISPSDYTSDLFNTIFESTSHYCEGFQFMSYSQGQNLLEGFELPFSDKKPYTLFDGVFAPFDFSGYELIGNIEYEVN